MWNRLCALCAAIVIATASLSGQQQVVVTDVISANGDLVVDPIGKDVLPNLGYDINLGSLQKKFLTLHAAELWVETLVAQNTMATIGGRVLVAPTNVLVGDLTAGALFMTVKYNNMAVNDRVYMEANGQVEFMAIASGPTGTAGNYVYGITRNLDGSGANAWTAGDAILNTGQAGNGFIDIYSTRGVRAGTEIGPTIVGNVRNSLTFNDWGPRWALGNLNGLYGFNVNTYGAAFGNPNGNWIIVEPIFGLRMGYGVTQSIAIDTAGNAFFAGSITATGGSIAGFTITGPYIFAGAGATRVGMSSDGANAFWAGGENTATSPFFVGSNGAMRATSATISGTISASTVSGSTVSGNTISGGTISGTTITGTTITGSTLQAGGSGGDVTIDSSGISITAGTGTSQRIKWNNSAQVYAASSYVELFGPSEVRLTSGGVVTADGMRPSSSGQGLGDSSHRWGETWISGDIHQTPSDTTSADVPMVYSIANGIYYKKTNTFTGTCSSGSFTVEKGIVTGC